MRSSLQPARTHRPGADRRGRALRLGQRARDDGSSTFRASSFRFYLALSRRGNGEHDARRRRRSARSRRSDACGSRGASQAMQLLEFFASRSRISNTRAWPRRARRSESANRAASSAVTRFTRNDVLQAGKFDDAVARSAYPIDVHNPPAAERRRSAAARRAMRFPIAPGAGQSRAVAGRRPLHFHDSRSARVDAADADGDDARSGRRNGRGDGVRRRRARRRVDTRELRRDIIADGVLGCDNALTRLARTAWSVRFADLGRMGSDALRAEYDPAVREIRINPRVPQLRQPRPRRVRRARGRDTSSTTIARRSAKFPSRRSRLRERSPQRNSNARTVGAPSVTRLSPESTAVRVDRAVIGDETGRVSGAGAPVPPMKSGRLANRRGCATRCAARSTTRAPRGALPQRGVRCDRRRHQRLRRARLRPGAGAASSRRLAARYADRARRRARRSSGRHRDRRNRLGRLRPRRSGWSCTLGGWGFRLRRRGQRL